MQPNNPSKKRKSPPKGEPAEEQQIIFPSVRRPHEAPTYVTEPGENDILLGRGKPIINYIGNQRYRALVRTRKDEYASSTRTDTKELIAREILAAISQRQGRFLQLVPADARAELRAQDPQIPADSKIWKVADMDTAIAKIKQTLRDREYVKSADRQVSKRTYQVEADSSAMDEGLSLQRLDSSAANPAVQSFAQVLVPTSAETGRHTMMALGGAGDSTGMQLSSTAQRQQQQSSDLELLQQLQILDRRRREADLRTQQIQLLIAQQQQASVLPTYVPNNNAMAQTTSGPMFLQQSLFLNNPELAALQEMVAIQNQQRQQELREYQHGGGGHAALSMGGQYPPQLEPSYSLNFPGGNDIPSPSSSFLHSADARLLRQLLQAPGDTGLSMSNDLPSQHLPMGTTRAMESLMAGGAQLGNVALTAAGPASADQMDRPELPPRLFETAPHSGHSVDQSAGYSGAEKSDDETDSLDD